MERSLIRDTQLAAKAIFEGGRGRGRGDVIRAEIEVLFAADV